MSRLYCRNGVWYIEVRRRGQKDRVSLGTKNYRTAQKLAGDLEEKLLRGQLGIGKGKSITIKDVCDDFMKYSTTIHSKSTTSSYKYTIRAYIIPMLGKVRADEISQMHLNDFIQGLCEKIGKPTVNKTLRYLRSILNWGKKNGNIVSELEFRSLRCAESKKHYLELDEIDKVLKNAGEYRLLILTAIHTGMRAGEIFNLKWEDIDFSEKIIHIVNCDDFHTKSYKNRVVPMTDRIASELLACHMRRNSGLVFPKSDGTRRISVRGAIEGISRRSGVKFTLHDLRRTFASHVGFGGRDVGGIQKLLGHSSIVTTMGYINHTVDRLRPLVKSMEKIGAEPDEQ